MTENLEIIHEFSNEVRDLLEQLEPSILDLEKVCDGELAQDSAEISEAGDTTSAKYYNNGLELTKKAGKVNNIEHFIRNIERAEPGDITDDAYNDLEFVVIERFPVIAEIKERLREQGAGFALMSGSGSTVFGVFDSREKAEDASRSFQDFWTAVVETLM